MCAVDSYEARVLSCTVLVSCHCLLRCPCRVELYDLLAHGFLDLRVAFTVYLVSSNRCGVKPACMRCRSAADVTWSWMCSRSLSFWTWLA